MPFYAGYAVDITLLWSRRRLTKIKLDVYEYLQSIRFFLIRLSFVRKIGRVN